jgi:hypothetical protein
VRYIYDPSPYRHKLIARAMGNMEVNAQDEVPDILPPDPEEDADLDIPASGQKKSQPLYDNTGERVLYLSGDESD